MQIKVEKRAPGHFKALSWKLWEGVKKIRKNVQDMFQNRKHARQYTT
jgi:hypothetical protein